ncbi:outer membrane protein assembly factor BamD [Agaricicola taiwanensis]|uniref:Outer membrane protein assembly factor BamD n=1 Tax=Agaricicola taiwanensis TaxID=591372 RepID=A0A8J2W286_9RHOB|nr:outer membrane protein assembly factor BamD [Agaricicola taiwanensis]GGE42409.1 outer membrane protein assembly factor BamD [Agaricicola taiwanensis]
MTDMMMRIRSRSRSALRVVAVLTVAVSLSACSIFGEKDEDAVVLPDEPADKLYNEGLYYVNEGNYNKAAEKFEEVDKQHPYTEWARKSLVMVAYSHYAQGNYDDAITNARRYLALHPGSEDAAYAQYILAMSYYNEIPDISRDQQRTQRALLALQEIADKYPNSEYAEPARQRIVVARDQLAGKEMEVGRYYLNQRNYIGAINRFRSVISDYQKTRHVEEALARVAEANMALGIVDEAQTAAAVLGHNFPDSQWYQDTYKLVQSRGLEPRENKESWISKAFRKVGFS